MFPATEPVSDLLTQFRGVKGPVDLEVYLQIATRLPVGSVAAVDVLAQRTGLTKVQTYSRIVEAGLRAFRQSLEPHELEAFNASVDQAVTALLSEADKC